MNGINIELENNELLIKGNKDDLLELAEYINKLATSSKTSDHIHLDELTIIDENSKVKNVIIEKED